MRQSVAIASFALFLGWPPPSALAQIPQTFTNLQVLPKDIQRPQLVATMRGFAGALGVRCTHCHVGPDNLQGMDFATDEKESKKVARTMLRMVRGINADVVGALPAADPPRQQVTCLTCHRRETKPPRPLPDVLLSTIHARGVPAAIEQYQKLRAEVLEAGAVRLPRTLARHRRHDARADGRGSRVTADRTDGRGSQAVGTPAGETLIGRRQRESAVPTAPLLDPCDPRVPR